LIARRLLDLRFEIVALHVFESKEHIIERRGYAILGRAIDKLPRAGRGNYRRISFD